ncbi:hypothetical protein BT96DRAFT_948587 [Gymnopus androsaceus JB14]|uniref:RING-type domain-containing protein n=1 Tax=Gymnopus androsaceus JB14 TaxID=1447944 RepID=A0A6A4GN23_9AGAR|nr:hypothetical protein BT96DRAFT_948587 [Gymnopus androsaceus JB14]
MLKVRVENLVAGEKLGTLWHCSFSSDAGRAFLRSLLSLTGALVFPDWRNKIVKAYGESSAIEKAREAIAQEIERLAGMEYTVPLKRASVRFFAQQGVASLKERFGEDNVWLNISNSPCLITIRGGRRDFNMHLIVSSNSLFMRFCPPGRCHEDGHEGMTCDERQQARSDQVNNDELNAEWAGKTGVKKCPKCDVWIEKTEGCNHIECRCGAHICWRCMGTFDGTTIYAHMSAVHNGYGLEEGVFHDVDRDEQARALQNFNDLAAARRLQQQEPARPYHHLLYPIEPPPPRNAQYYQALDAERRIAAQAEQQRRHRQQLQEQRIRDLEATRRRARQEEGGNWCTIM